MLTVGSFGPHIYAWIRVSSEFPGLRENVKSPESRSYIRGFCDVLCGNEGKVVWWGWSSGGEEYPPARTLHTSPARTLSPRTLPNVLFQGPPRTLHLKSTLPHVLFRVPHVLFAPVPHNSFEEYPCARTHCPAHTRPPHVLFSVPHVLFTRVPCSRVPHVLFT
jgi:hypothetical protein